MAKRGRVVILPRLKVGLQVGLVVGLMVALVATGLLLADRLLPPNLARLTPSPTLLDRDGRLMALYADRAGLIRLPTSMAEVAPVYLDLLVATEDKRFWWHPGVDPLALSRAAWQWVSRGRVVSGGSTLTMQTVRLLEPRPRTLASKAIEVLRALQLEWRFTKPEILRFYLTLAPMGGNLEGLRAGAWAWFGKTPAALDLSEAAMLVALPQAPSSLRPDRFADRLEVRRNRILAAAPTIASPQHRAEAMAEPVPRSRHPLPDLAPQLAGRLLAAHPSQPIRTTLDAAMQRLAQRSADRLAGTLDPAASVAILVVEVAERQVRAHIGGRSHPDRAEGAWIDLAVAVRSPGSTLKPFVYGLGFEDRVIGPHTLLTDLPTRFGDYAPGNFDHGHVGQLTAADALRRSLNVPAVAVLEAVGPRRFAAALHPLAPLRLPQGATPGLPLVLGGAGTTLWDLATLYAALADGGQMQPLALTGPTAPLGQLMSAEAAGAVNRVLLEAPAPAGRARWRAAVGGPRFALKTGTSYGFRDAVAIGYSARWVVAVWIGRPDGEPHPGHYGLASAAPLVWDLFDQLPDGPPPPLDRGFTGGPQRFVSGDPIARALARPLQPGLSLAFPPEGARLPRQTILVRATGGTRPLTLLVDGSPVATQPLAREFEWTPTHSRHRLAIVDATGASVAVSVEVE